MYRLIELFQRIQDVDGLVRWGGYMGVALIIFAETGLFFGFFLPGDSLLVTAGLFAGKGDLNVVLLFVLTALAAIVGDATGFEIGRVSGRAIFSRPNSRFFKKEHVERTRLFYERYGGKTIVLARFMPIIRTFAPVVAGVAGMEYRTFALYNITGGIAWVGSMIGIGYVLGRTIPHIDQYIHILVLGIIFLSFLPGIVSYARSGHWRRWFEKRSKA